MLFFFFFFRPELKGKTSIIRELHVYGSVVGISARDPTKFQHQGFGILLMEEAERIAKEEHNSEKIVVISGILRFYVRVCFNYFIKLLKGLELLIDKIIFCRCWYT